LSAIPGNAATPGPDWSDWDVQVEWLPSPPGQAWLHVVAVHATTRMPLKINLMVEWAPGEEREDVKSRGLSALQEAIDGLSASLAKEAVLHLSGGPSSSPPA
jgi:hypothetical protein